MIDLPSAIADFRSRGATSFHAKADNLAFEGRLSDERLSDYAAYAATQPGWAEHHASYVAARIEIDGSVPDTFLPINALAHYEPGTGDDRAIVRLERISRALVNKNCDFDQIERWFRLVKGDIKGDRYEKEDAQASLEEFISLWNSDRDARPTFATFEDQVGAELSAVDWANRLRDRLGLGHHALPRIPVLLMRYTVGDVRKAAVKNKSNTPFALPTALDGGMSEWFFPAPASVPPGRTMSLQPDPNDERLVAEFLHQRINYTLKHMMRLGEISTPLPGHSLKALRNDHLLRLRLLGDQDDFGQDIPEHVAD